MKILLADDDRYAIDLIRYAFQRDGHTVILAFDGEQAMRLFKAEAPDLVVLDLLMPKRNGLEVLEEIRRQSQVPVLMLTAVEEEERVVTALDIGADEYLVKPFRPRELQAHVRALARRAAHQPETPIKPSKAISRGGVTLDPLTRQVTVEGRSSSLTNKEFAVLYYLMLNDDIVLANSYIIDNVWGFYSPDDEDVLQVTIYRLRQKLEPDPAHPQYVVKVPGQGYMFHDRSREQ
jgi:DNA-binding response OmpR family regulator